MEEAKVKISEFLTKIINFKYSYTKDDMRKLLNDIGFKEDVKNKRKLKRILLNKWINEKKDNDKMDVMTYIIDPCKEINLFIKLLDGMYLPIVLLKGERKSPVFNDNIFMNYIYIYTTKLDLPTIYFLGSDIISKERTGYITKYYEGVRDNLTNLIMKMNNIDNNDNNDNMNFNFYPELKISIISSYNNLFDKDLIKKRMIQVSKNISKMFLLYKRRKEALDSKHKL